MVQPSLTILPTKAGNLIPPLIWGDGYSYINWMSSLVKQGGSQSAKLLMCPSATQKASAYGFSYGMSPAYNYAVNALASNVNAGNLRYWGLGSTWWPMCLTSAQQLDPVKLEKIAYLDDKILMMENYVGCANVSAYPYPAIGMSTSFSTYAAGPNTGAVAPVWGSAYLPHVNLSANSLGLDGSVRNLPFGQYYNSAYNYYGKSEGAGYQTTGPWLNPMISSVDAIQSNPALGQIYPSVVPFTQE